MNNCNYCCRSLQQSGIITLLSNGSYVLMCPNCHQYVYTCALCTFGQYCAFEQDPSPIPKQVPKTLRQGNMMMQTVVRNPARIEALCTSCTCFNSTLGACGRDDNYCLSYKEWEPSITIEGTTSENPPKNPENNKNND